uniref:Protein disulfide-isomerase n=1 Tax=Scleropages formosus TaxID=113540 RepID=A0A8C9RFC2_SCLFO
MSRLLPAVTLPLLALLGIAVLAAGSDVLELSDSDFDYTVAEHETMLVEFFAPWCGHCQKLAPEYESAATQLKGTVPLAKVDCTVNSQTCGRFGVNGYPTLKIFRNGQEASAYDGPRSAEGIVSYMKKQAGPNSTPLHSQEGLDTFINNFDASVVGFFSRSDSVLLAEFKKAASAMRDSYRFAHTTGLELGLKDKGRSSCEGSGKLKDSLEESGMGIFNVKEIQLTARRDIGKICENKDNLKNRDLVTAYYNVDYLRNPKGSNYWRNRILKVATQFQSRGLSFSVADRQEFQDDLEEDFGISPSDGAELPLITIRTREGHKYIMQEEFTRDGKALEKFLEDYFAGKLKRFLKSEPRPENNNGPVKVVVAETFEEIVNDPTKDVLIEFYAPWCGHCKNLEPKYTELGEQLADDHNIVIAKMDATANDVPSNYDVQGFPTIYFAKAGMKDSPMPYEGAREVKDLLSFLKKEATHPPILKREDEEQKVCS